MTPPTPPAPTPGLLSQACVLLACYWLAWQGSALFEIRPDVSALYLSAGLTTAAGMIGGWRALPLACIAICLVRLPDLPVVSLATLDLAGALRQVAVYGAAGLYLRRRWQRAAFRFSLKDALHFTVVALVASCMSAGLSLHIPPFDSLPQAELGGVFLSFWGGGLAGMLLLIPVIVMLQARLGPRRASFVRRWKEAFAERPGEASATALLVAAACFTLIVVTLPELGQAGPRLAILSVLPVLVASLLRGVLFGFVVALLTCVIELAPIALFELPVESVLDLQLRLIITTTTALLAGASHDDKLFEWRHANFDLLTGLANRHRFQDQIEHELMRARRHRHSMALLYIDLDGFKAVNDAYGHDAGDALLRQVAERLQTCVRETDTIARLGGDEFTIILPDLAHDGVVARIGHDVLRELMRPYALGGVTAHVSASIGLALHPRDGESATDLIRNADRAMYEAKRLGRNRMVRHASIALPVFTPRSDAPA